MDLRISQSNRKEVIHMAKKGKGKRPPRPGY